MPLALLAILAAPPAEIDIPFEKYVLPQNGLEVILSPNHDLPIVAVDVWYHVGPVNEPAGRTGFAHLFEHLMFQGSAHVGDDMHIRMLQAAGATSLNGTTDYDRTNYFETVPKNQLALALWLESDRMGFLAPALTQEKLDNQRQVVMNERRQSVENQPYGPSDEKLVQLLFPPSHPYYGNVIGSMADLNAATLQDVRDFYEHYYAPANATLVIAGDFDPAEAKDLVERYFGTLPARSTVPTPTIDTPAITQERRAELPEPVALARVKMAWLSPPAFAPGDAEADILAIALGHGKSSRLYRTLVYEQQIAQSVSVRQESLALASIFTITVTARPGVSPQQLEAEVAKAIEKLEVEPLTADEVERARNFLLTSAISGLQRMGGFGGRADMLNLYNHYLDQPGYFEQDIERYRAVTPSAVRDLAKRLLDPNARAVVITVPKGGSPS